LSIDGGPIEFIVEVLSSVAPVIVCSREEKLMRFLRESTVSRATFIRGMAGGLALTAVGGPLAGLQAVAAEMDFADATKVLPLPKPIPSVTRIPDLPAFHAHEPGPTTIKLPFTGADLEGLDVEPNTITDFKGVIVQAYHVGTATGSDGKQYNLETDVRAYKGEYVAEDGSHHKGTFALL
jgi:hypothetical protein